MKDSRIICYSFSNDPFVYNITFPRIDKYCKTYNYGFNPYHENLELVYKPHWNKLHYAIRLMETSDSEYIVWFDHDVVIKNFDIKIEEIIKEYKFEENNALFMMSADPASNYSFNTGVIVFKNNERTLEIFKTFLKIRNNPRNYENLSKFGGFNFGGGMQDTRVMLTYFDINPQDLFSVPHKVLQSFYGQAHYYEKGDFCGHVAGPQGQILLDRLQELVNL